MIPLEDVIEMKHLEACLNRLIEEKRVGNIAVRAGVHDRVLMEAYRSPDGSVNEDTLFDMASVTKILAVTNLSLMALDRGLIRLDDPVSKYFPCGPGKEKLTVFNLLTHTIGIGHKSMLAEGNTYDNIAEYILKIPCDIPIGSDVLYSCPAFIVLGKLMEKIFGRRLDVLFREMVAQPLGLTSTGFLPQDVSNMVNANPEADKLGWVNDYNCRFLGRVAGNAGIFSNVRDLTRFAQFLIGRGQPLFSEKTFELARRNHTPSMAEARGLGYVYVDERYPQTGRLFPAGSIGHCGHTGQSVFVHPESGLYVIILSDATISTVRRLGREDYGEVMCMRAEVHNAVKADMESGN